VSVDREITESSEVQPVRVELYRVHGRTISEDVTGILPMAVIEIVNCVNVRASVQ
jgi:hypothetical protein